MIAPLILMAWGIWERVSIFGLTEARYFVALLWAWFAISTIIILIRASKTALMTIRSAEKSPPPTKEQKINVSTILDYLSTRNRLADITHLYIKSNNFESKEILTPKNISVGLGVSYIEYSERAHSNSSYSLNFKATVGDLPLQSYTHIIPNITLSKYRKLSQSFDIKGVGAFTVKYSPETHLLEINQRSISSSLYQSNLLDLINKLFAGSTESLHNSPALTTQSKNGIPVQIIFTGLTALSNSDKSLINKIDDVSFIILIKRSSKKIVF